MDHFWKDNNLNPVCHNKWHPGTMETSTPPEIAVGTHFHARHGTKLPSIFTCWWRSILVPTSKFDLLITVSGGTVQPENTYSCILKVIDQVCKSQKTIISKLITYTTSAHLPKPVSTDLTKSDSILTSPKRKDGARLFDVIKHLANKVFLLSDTTTRRVANHG